MEEPNGERLAALEAAIARETARLKAEDARNRKPLELLIRAIDAAYPQLAGSPLVTQIADDILGALFTLLDGLITENPFRVEQAERRRRLQYAARVSHFSTWEKRGAVQAAWLEMERCGSRKSKAQFAAEQAQKLNLSTETVRRWLRAGELRKP